MLVNRGHTQYSPGKKYLFWVVIKIYKYDKYYVNVQSFTLFVKGGVHFLLKKEGIHVNYKFFFFYSRTAWLS